MIRVLLGEGGSEEETLSVLLFFWELREPGRWLCWCVSVGASGVAGRTTAEALVAFWIPDWKIVHGEHESAVHRRGRCVSGLAYRAVALKPRLFSVHPRTLCGHFAPNPSLSETRTLVVLCAHPQPPLSRLVASLTSKPPAPRSVPAEGGGKGG